MKIEEVVTIFSVVQETLQKLIPKSTSPCFRCKKPVTKIGKIENWYCDQCLHTFIKASMCLGCFSISRKSGLFQQHLLDNPDCMACEVHEQ